MRQRRARAFTLIELLVVVAIIALLISILLPSLSKARESAKSVKCLSNLRQIGIAMQNYAEETNGWFPFEKRNMTTTPLHAFYYGGHPGRPGWWGYDNPAYRDTPAGRPFNRYIYSGLSSAQDQRRDEGTAEFEQRREMPVFECPSDIGGFIHTETDIETDDRNSVYYTNGSSYDENYHFVWRWARYGPNRAERPPQYLERANKFLAVQRRLNASRFVILFEDPFDSAQWEEIPRRGWHQRWNTHNFLFLDSHAAATYADPSQANYGPDWKASSGFWWNDPADPDYVYRDMNP